MLKFLFVFLMLSFPLLSNADAGTSPFFSVEQEKYLAEHPSVLAYFSRLYQGDSPEQVAKQYGLSKSVNDKYLNALAQIKVIEKASRSAATVRFLVTGLHSHAVKGPLTEKFTQSRIKQSLEEAQIRWTKNGERDDLFLSPAGYWLTEKQNEALQKDIAALEVKYIDLSLGNRKSKTPGAFRVTSLLVLLPNWEPLELTEIKKTFD